MTKTKIFHMFSLSLSLPWRVHFISFELEKGYNVIFILGHYFACTAWCCCCSCCYSCFFSLCFWIKWIRIEIHQFVCKLTTLYNNNSNNNQIFHIKSGIPFGHIKALPFTQQSVHIPSYRSSLFRTLWNTHFLFWFRCCCLCCCCFCCCSINWRSCVHVILSLSVPFVCLSMEIVCITLMIPM